MRQLKNLIKRNGFIIRKRLCYTVDIWIPIIIIFRNLQCMALIILKCKGVGTILYDQFGRHWLTIYRVRRTISSVLLTFLSQCKYNGAVLRHDKRVAFHVIRDIAEYLRTTGFHRTEHGVCENRAIGEVRLSSRLDRSCPIGRLVRLLITLCAVAGHRLRSIVGNLGADIIICQLIV